MANNVNNVTEQARARLASMLTLALLVENKWVWNEKVQKGARKHFFPSIYIWTHAFADFTETYEHNLCPCHVSEVEAG